MSAPGLLEVDIGEKRHGARAVLRNLHLRVNAGEIVSLIGASGCGKSTLLSLVAGLDHDYRGRITVDGRTLNDAGGAGGAAGLVFQEPRLFPWLTVADNIAFGAQGDDRNARVAALLEEVGLSGYGDALPKSLSGGQAQRVAIARGLYGRPRLLLLDEPFSAVDAFTRMRLQDLLLRIAREHALTILLVTHDIDEALYLSDRVLQLDNGPGPLRAEYTVTLLRPRDRGDAAFAPLKAEVLRSLHAAHAI